MAGEYTKFYVSNKIAIYSHDLKTVMLMEYKPRGIWGLPGGHLDPGEEPEVGMARELQEELGVTVDNIEKCDFFVRNFGDDGEETVILAYKAIAPEGFTTSPTDFVKEHDIWVTPEEVPSFNLAESYKKFVLENWPK
jgi:8-oxo-dGTP pyrophosphatase MutT (NUDIX family)